MCCDIVFVCQAGEIEQQSILLAQSIRLFGGRIATAHLHALIPIPEDVYGSVGQETLKFLESLGVQLYYRRNPINDNYKYANKLTAFQIDSKTDTIVFLDTDIIILNDFSELIANRQTDVLAKPAVGQWPFSFSKAYGEKLWKGLYAEFGLEVPSRKILASVIKREMLPYFNAGVIVAPSHAGLSDLWIRVAKEFNRMKLPHKYPWLDQIALPVAISLGNLSWDTLDEDHNFGLALWLLKKRLHWILGRFDWFDFSPTLSSVKILHYHLYRTLEQASRQDSELGRKFERLLDGIPFKRDVLAVPLKRSMFRRISAMWHWQKWQP